MSTKLQSLQGPNQQRHPPKVYCQKCLLRSLCLPDHLPEACVNEVERIVVHRAPLDKNQHLFRTGETFENFYVVRAGTVKNYQLSRDGDEEVTGFAFPGEVIGLDGMADGVHPTAAVALERTMVCAIPMQEFEQVATGINGLTHRFTRMVGKYIVSEQDLLTIRARDTAEERMALFLLNLSERFRSRGFDGQEFELGMSRRDIGKYLSLAVETVSRSLTRFRSLGLIDLERRRVRLNDKNGLERIARL